MADLPQATVSIENNAGTPASGLRNEAVFAAVPSNADGVPRLFGNVEAMISFHGYAEYAEYAALRFKQTKQPILMMGMPIETAGVVGRENTGGNTDTCVTTVTAGGSGVLMPHDGVLRVVAGGTIGTDQIVIELSLDGGTTFKRIRLGTGNSYTVPYVGVSIAFAAGDLTTGETIHTWHGTGPLYDGDGVTLATTELAAQQKRARSWQAIGNVPDDTLAGYWVSAVNDFETESDRATYVRIQARDHLPPAELSATTHRMTGAPSLTFADADDTITRAVGSWLADGFAEGDVITVTGVTNAGTFNVTAVTATVLTVETGDLADETSALATIVGEPSLTFANTGETITRNRGSWLDDGFRAGDLVTIAGTAGAVNDVTDFVVSTVTALVLTLAAGGVDADEVIGVTAVTVTAGEQLDEFLTNVEDELSALSVEPRVSVGVGYCRGPASPIQSFRFRLPASWAASLRCYQHDVHIPSWKKREGPLSSCDLVNADGQTVEVDARNNPGALAGRFTCFRTFANGPEGVFIAQDLTRAGDGSVLQYVHIRQVADIACNVVQAATENLIGETPLLNEDGTATAAELSRLAEGVNSSLEQELLKDKGEGQRASSVLWEPNADDDLSAPDATLTGVLTLITRGTIVNVATSVKIPNA